MNVRDVSTTFTLAALQADSDVLRPGREVQHGRNAADGLQRKERHGDAGRVRQQDADGRALIGQRCDLGAQNLRAGDQLLVAELGAERIFNSWLARVARCLGQHERFEQRLIDRRGHHRAIGHHVLKREARGLTPGLAAQCLVDFQIDGRQNGDGGLWKPGLLRLLRT